MQLSLTFNGIVVEAVAQEQENAEATVAVIKKHKPLYVIEEALVPSPSVSHANRHQGTNPEHGFHEARNIYLQVRVSLSLQG